MVRDGGDSLNSHFRSLPTPMGVAFNGRDLAIGTRSEIMVFQNQPASDARASTRPTVTTAASSSGAATRPATSACTTSRGATRDSGSSTPASRASPRSTTSTPSSRGGDLRSSARSRAEDRCHLNGLAVIDGAPKYVTVLGTTDEAGGWRERKADGGAILDVPSGEVVDAGLSMPHSPRWHDGRLWVLESGRGKLAVVDPATGTREDVAEVPGFARGLTFVGRYALVGLSHVREHTFDGLPLTQRPHRTAAVRRVDRRHRSPARSPATSRSPGSCRRSSRSRCCRDSATRSWSNRARRSATPRSCCRTTPCATSRRPPERTPRASTPSTAGRVGRSRTRQPVNLGVTTAAGAGVTTSTSTAPMSQPVPWAGDPALVDGRAAGRRRDGVEERAAGKRQQRLGGTTVVRQRTEHRVVRGLHVARRVGEAARGVVGEVVAQVVRAADELDAVDRTRGCATTEFAETNPMATTLAASPSMASEPTPPRPEADLICRRRHPALVLLVMRDVVEADRTLHGHGTEGASVLPVIVELVNSAVVGRASRQQRGRGRSGTRRCRSAPVVLPENVLASR